MKRRAILGVAVSLGLLAGRPALACAACFGKSDSSMAYGMNAGIFTLLAVIVTMLSLIASFFVFVARRASRAGVESESNPPSA